MPELKPCPACGNEGANWGPTAREIRLIAQAIWLAFVKAM
jgi:hypothetical protein